MRSCAALEREIKQLIREMIAEAAAGRLDSEATAGSLEASEGENLPTGQIRPEDKNAVQFD